ncbi:MAG: methionyl-tRNA formyltransferase [Candidatus Dojkabacteria bacterium]|jgi:methionyl-tRNA formyltransferase|nr:methionyl-tRNA formyltransferase [Candidatus Dojkabacteria bacterium]
MRNLIEQPVNTLFLGTDWESVETLEALNKDERFNIVGVITTVDKPVGRKQILTPSKVKEYAVKNGIEVFHTQKREERYQESLEKFKPELIVCKAFGEIVPGFFLEYPKYKSINVHFSILPKYRGAVPIQKAILEGEEETGISIMLMAEGMDEGDILEIFKEPIHSNDTNLSLRERLVKKSATILGDVLENWVKGEIQPIKQDDSKATYCWQKDISKENAQIKWDEMEPEYIERLVRAMIPWPVAWCVLDRNEQESISNKVVKLFEVELMSDTSNLKPGTLYSKDGMLLFKTKKEGVSLRVKELQIEGKNIVKERDLINGIGKILS